MDPMMSHRQTEQLAAPLCASNRSRYSRHWSDFAGNKTRAAEHLGINRKTLREKMQKYDL